MSLWRWIPISNCNAAGMALTAAVLAACALPHARADDPSHVTSGPSSSAEAAILWQDGQAAFEKGRFEVAIPKLERFVARYPGYPDHADAQHLLAQAYLQTQHPARAIAPLKAYIIARGKQPGALRARTELCRAQLQLAQYSEALLTAEETLKLAAGPAHAERHAESLILRARAQLGLHQDDRAAASVTDALASFKSSPEPVPSHLLGDAHDVELELKLRQCARFPSPGTLAEAQVRDQLGRRGACLLDALLSYRETLAANANSSNLTSEQSMSEAYASYWKSCRNPPPPPPTEPKDRDAQQLKTYFRELAVVLEEDCRQKIRQGLDLMNGWRATLPVGAADSLKKSVGTLTEIVSPPAKS